MSKWGSAWKLKTRSWHDGSEKFSFSLLSCLRKSRHSTLLGMFHSHWLYLNETQSDKNIKYSINLKLFIFPGEREICEAERNFLCRTRWLDVGGWWMLNLTCTKSWSFSIIHWTLQGEKHTVCWKSTERHPPNDNDSNEIRKLLIIFTKSHKS